MAEDQQVGFVGIGNMGAPMVRNLAKAKIPVLAFDLRPEVLDAVTADSNLIARASSLAEVGEKCSTVITMLPTGADVREAVLGEGGIASRMAPGGIILDMSSSEPTGTVELAKDLEARGLHLIDAPVSGGVPGAVNATLALMTGGEDDVVARVERTLDAMGNIYRTGPVGSGHAAKALNNFLSAASLTATSEALVVAQKVRSRWRQNGGYLERIDRTVQRYGEQVASAYSESEVCCRFYVETARQGREDRPFIG